MPNIYLYVLPHTPYSSCSRKKSETFYIFGYFFIFLDIFLYFWIFSFLQSIKKTPVMDSKRFSPFINLTIYQVSLLAYLIVISSFLQ